VQTSVGLYHATNLYCSLTVVVSITPVATHYRVSLLLHLVIARENQHAHARNAIMSNVVIIIPFPGHF